MSCWKENPEDRPMFRDLVIIRHKNTVILEAFYCSTAFLDFELCVAYKQAVTEPNTGYITRCHPLIVFLATPFSIIDKLDLLNLVVVVLILIQNGNFEHTRNGQRSLLSNGPFIRCRYMETAHPLPVSAPLGYTTCTLVGGCKMGCSAISHLLSFER